MGHLCIINGSSESEHQSEVLLYGYYPVQCRLVNAMIAGRETPGPHQPNSIGKPNFGSLSVIYDFLDELHHFDLLTAHVREYYFRFSDKQSLIPLAKKNA